MPAKAADTPPIKIGVLTDMTGPLAETTGKGSVIAVQMAVEDFGGKVLGRSIDVLSADHQNKADIAVGIARRWYDIERVDLITDLQNSSVALAVQGLAREQGKLTIVTGAGSSDLTGPACSPTGIHWTVDTYSAATSLVKALAKRGPTTWFFLTSDYAFGHTLQKDATRAIAATGSKVLGSVRVPLGAHDYSSFLLQAQSAAPKVLALANAGSDFANSTKQAGEFGLEQQGITLAGLYAGIQPIKSLGTSVAHGMLVPETFYWDLDERSRHFSLRFFDRMKIMPSQLHAGAYSATLNYLRAVDKAQSTEPKAVVQALSEMPIEDDVTRNGRVRVDGRMVHDTYLFEVKTPAESKGDWDLYKLIETVSGSDAFRPVSEGGCPLVKTQQ
jgi:branched-chain amino acid transport system substrate-binding protein